MEFELPYCPACGKRLGVLDIAIYVDTLQRERALNEIGIVFNRECDCPLDLAFRVGRKCKKGSDAK